MSIIDLTPRRCLEALDIFILAGGLGTRLRPVLGELPKLMAPISGQPYLAHLIHWLHRFGARRVVLGLGYRAQAVIDYLRSHPFSGLEIVPIVEPQPLGTAGAIRFARAELRTDPVLVMNGDSFTDADICEFIEYHGTAAAMGSIICVEVDDAGRYGRVLIDEHGRIGGFIEKDANFHGSAAVNAGIYLLSAALIDDIAAGQAVSLERGVFERLPAASLAAFVGRFAFLDIGTPQSFAMADSLFDALRFS